MNLSRRNLFRSMLAAGATLPFHGEAALAQLSMVSNIPADAVKINANENPMGPCPEAAEAIYSVVKKGGRYLYEETFIFQKARCCTAWLARRCHHMTRLQRQAQRGRADKPRCAGDKQSHNRACA